MFKKYVAKGKFAINKSVNSHMMQNIYCDTTDNNFEIRGYDTSIIRTILTVFLCLLSFGLGFLILYWRIDWRIKLTHRRCSLAEAKILLCKDSYNRITLSRILLLHFDHGMEQLDFDDTKFNLIDVTTMNAVENVEELLLQQSPIYLRYFEYKRLFYVWDPTRSRFTRLRALDKNFDCRRFSSYKPLNECSRCFRKQLFGINTVETGRTPLLVILIEKILTKFYIFQIFSCALWYSDEYAIYATCILVISALSISVGVYETMKSERDIHALSLSSGYIQILISDGDRIEKQYTKIEDLVPGDVIIINDQMSMPCDAVLLDGNVLMDESKLTGESVPVTKTPITSDVFNNETLFDITEYLRHVLFSGTSVIQTRFISGGIVRAVVVRSGFSTLRGELIRNILYPKPALYEYEADVTRYIKCLAVLASCGMLYTLILKILNKDNVSTIIKRCLDIITICVPPALPAALLTGIIYAQRRLKKEKIYCISPNLINISGTVDTIVFDKTGTLTEDGLDLRCILLCNNPPNADCNPNFSSPVFNIDDIPNHSDMIMSMATCHNITKIHADLAGDPIDLKMFEFTRWNLFVPDVDEAQLFENIVPTVVKSPDKLYEVAIVKSFPFSSKMQRMSVITRNSDNSKCNYICKGSPEKIVSLCNPSTVPTELSDVLNDFTEEGYRVIALAKKSLVGGLHRLLRLERKQLEADLNFLGLIVLENKLKEETSPVIKSLQLANLRQIMCTGDNLLTSISVARNCKLVNTDKSICTINHTENNELQFKWSSYTESTEDSQQNAENNEVILNIGKWKNFCFALDGPVFSIIKEQHPDLYDMVLVRGAIFARMLPEQKQQLVESLKNVGYSVIMCGDGANDCGALKAADTGISLSTTEASVASPFTSLVQNISCVPKLIRDGRCSLVTSFGLVKFICMYSLVQFTSISVLYTFHTLFADPMFMYIDIGLLTPLVCAFSLTKPINRLSKTKPPSKLFCFSSFISMITQFMISLISQILIAIIIINQPWYQVTENGGDSNDYFSGYIVSGVFLISNLQYIAHSVIYSSGFPFRRSIFTNAPFIVVIAVAIFSALWLMITPGDSFTKIMKIRPFPRFEFRFYTVVFSVIVILIMWMVETFLFEHNVLRYFATLLKIKQINVPKYFRKAEPKFKDIEKSLELNLPSIQL